MKTRKSTMRFGILILGAALGTAPLEGQKPLAPALSHYTLKNGLAVVLSENADLPLVSVVVGYSAGSIYELPGKTGVSYLLEKLMMSAGSANVAPFAQILDINRVGGSLNANALEDQTLYYQTVPSNHLAMALWLESDRMRTLEITEENFEKARGELLQELLDRKTTESYLTSLLAFDQLIYSDFPFSHSLLGEEIDVRNLTLEDVKSFYEARYAPSNAVLCISGNFNKLKARELVARYFESLPAGKSAPTTFEPPYRIKALVDKTMVDAMASAPGVFIGFRLAAPASEYYPIITLLDFVLMRGRSARLPRRLLNREAKIAFQLSGGIERRLNRSVYKIFIAASQTQIPFCRAAVFAELEKLKTKFLGEGEIAKAKTLFRQNILSRTTPTIDRAIFLTESYWIYRSAGRTLDDLGKDLESVLRVTASDLVGIMARYFTLDNCVILQVQMK
jgi:zinc protease